MDFWVDLMSRQWPNACWIVIYAICLGVLIINRNRWGVWINKVLVFLALTLVLYYCPLSANILVGRLLPGQGEYERIAWLLFIIPVIAFTFVRTISDLKKKQRVKASVFFVVMCILLGELPLFSQKFVVADNEQKLTDSAIEIADAITDDANCYSDDTLLGMRQVSVDDKGNSVKPNVLVQVEVLDHLGARNIYYGIRQYTSAPVLTSVVVPDTTYSSSSFKLSKFANLLNYEYFVCTNNENLKMQAEKQGFELLKEVNKYAVYKNTKELTVYFIRHGETSANANGIYSGSMTNPALTNKGVSSSKTTGKVLQDIKFDKVYVSELTRSSDTAKFILSENNNKVPAINVMKLLNDANLGAVEGLSREEVAERYPDFSEDKFFGTISDSKFVSPIGATSKYKTVQNYKSALDKIVSETSSDSKVLIVGHSAFVWLLQTIFPNEISEKSSLDNTSITVVKYKKGKYELEAYNTNASQFKEIEQ